MKLKERERSSLFNEFRKFFYSVKKVLFDERFLIILGLGIIFVFFIFGILFGLIISGFFGTLDTPSQKALDVIHSLGFYGLGEIKARLYEIKHENIKIPFHYLSGQFSNPKKIYIDIGFEELQKIEYKREQALSSLSFEGYFTPPAGILIASDEDYVPAKITYDKKEIDVKLRLKGDLTDHLDGNKWSFRIKVKGDDSLFGMKSFSIQDPKARGYIDELIYHQALKKEGVLSLRYDFVEVIINGENKGIYAIEEHFGKELIEYNNRREGVIVKFNENPMWEDILNSADEISNYEDYFEYMDEKYLDWFYNSDIDSFETAKINENSVLSEQFEKSKNLLEYFRRGSLKTSEVFDIDKLAKYFAINTLTGSSHASGWNNIRFYYNPITSRLEPVGYDAEGSEDALNVINYYSPSCFYGEECREIKGFEELIFRDEIFFKKYLEELERVSEKEYLDNLFSELNSEIDKDVDIIHKDHPSYYFSNERYYSNQIQIKKRLEFIKGFNVYLDEIKPLDKKIVLSVGNIVPYPLEIVGLNYNGSVYFEVVSNEREVKPKSINTLVKYQKFEFNIPDDFIWNESFIEGLMLDYKIFGTDKILSQKIYYENYIKDDFLQESFMINPSVINSLEFFSINENTKTIILNSGDWVISEDLIIPKNYNVYLDEGVNIDLINGASFISYSPLQLLGTKSNPINFFSSDNTGQGLVVLNADKTSNFNYANIDGLTNPSKKGWDLTGAVTFYESPIKFNNVKISNSNSEDGLNIINSKFEIKNSKIENSFSDCFDSDFGIGIIESSSFVNCGNDGLDFSGAFVNVTNVNIIGFKDKGMSGGEKSFVNLEDVNISGNELKGNIGIASKDKSEVFIKNSEISNVKYGFSSYQKKPEYGPASIKAENVILLKTDEDYFIEENSNLLIDNIIILNKEKNVYDKLYPEG